MHRTKTKKFDTYPVEPSGANRTLPRPPLDRLRFIHGIERRLTKPNHPWMNGQVERMNRTIEDATVKRYFYDIHNQLKAHLTDFLRAYNFTRRLKTLKGLTPYEYLCELSQTDLPHRDRRWSKSPMGVEWGLDVNGRFSQ